MKADHARVGDIVKMTLALYSLIYWLLYPYFAPHKNTRLIALFNSDIKCSPAPKARSRGLLIHIQSLSTAFTLRILLQSQVGVLNSKRESDGRGMGG